MTKFLPNQYNKCKSTKTKPSRLCAEVLPFKNHSYQTPDGNIPLEKNSIDKIEEFFILPPIYTVVVEDLEKTSRSLQKPIVK